MLARLSLFAPLRPARQTLLEPGREYLVGRGGDCDVVVDDDRISRHHARLTPGVSAWLVIDLGSKNGTRLDGRPVAEPVPLDDGAWLSFGGLPARFELVSEDQRRRDSRQVLERWASTWAGHRSLGPGEDLAALPGRLLRSILEVSGSERGFVLVARPDGELEVAATGGGLEAEELLGREFSGSVAAVDRVLSTGEPVVVSDARDDALLGSRPSVVEGGIRALVCLPLRVRGRPVGAVYVDSRRPGTTFTELDLEILEAMSAHAGLALAMAGIDRELRALAARIAAEPGLEREARERLRRDAESAWDRALTPAGGSSGAGRTTWAALRRAHPAAAPGGSS